MSGDAPTIDTLLNVSASLRGRRWVLRAADDAETGRIARENRIDDLLARLLAVRGVSADEAAAFLEPRLRDHFPDPSSFQDMDLAASRIWDAVEAKRSITVFADYDVDGATSAAQLILWLRSQGIEAGHYVPDRIEEGYGPNLDAFKRLHAEGTDLVITVDCGAAAHETLNAAAEMGLDVIVIDHHLMDEDFPKALALVNPNRPDDSSGCGHMAAAGVTFILLAALNREGRRRGRFEAGEEPDILAWSDLAALGTICDVVPLTGINRALVATGLKVMSRWQSPGLAALADIAGVEGVATPYHAGFLLGPRINAGGRVGQADLGTRLLTRNEPDELKTIAGHLDRFNAERKAIEADVLDGALAQLEGQAQGRSVLIAAEDGWHPGVIGVVAGRIKEKYAKPAIIIGIDRQASPPIAKGSGRSVPGVNLGGAIVAAREAGLLLAGGGHEMAAGLSADPDRLTELSAFLDDYLSGELARAEAARQFELDALLTIPAATLELCDRLAALAPYGQGMPEPRFALAGVRVSYAKRVGSDHVRATLSSPDGAKLQAIAFRCADEPLGEALLSASSSKWHVAGRLSINSWQGRNSVQLQIEDMASADD